MTNKNWLGFKGKCPEKNSHASKNPKTEIYEYMSDDETDAETPDSSLAFCSSIDASMSLMDISIEDDELESPLGSPPLPPSIRSRINSKKNNDSIPSSLKCDDEESTLEQTGESLGFLSETFTGNFCANQIDQCQQGAYNLVSGNSSKGSSSLLSEKLAQGQILKDIHFLLGSSVAPCCEENNFLLTCFQPFLFCCSGNPNDEKSENSCVISIRNRAGESWRARAYRIRRLREEHMNIKVDCSQDSTSSGSSRNRKPSHSHRSRTTDPIKSSRSADDDAHHKIRNRESSPPPVIVEDSQNSFGCNIAHCMDPMSSSPQRGNIEIINKEKQSNNQNKIFDVEEDLCYDSDPGDRSHKHGTNAKKGLMVQSLHMSLHMNSSINNMNGHDYLDNSEMLSDNMRTNDIEDKTRLEEQNPHNGLNVINTIQRSLNETWTMTWHPSCGNLLDKLPSDGNLSPSYRRSRSTSSLSLANVTPRCVRVWFERGNRIRQHEIVEPKLMWRDAYHPDLVSSRKLNLSSTDGPYQVCLLNICRVIATSGSIDRTKYPFAKQSSSFLIRSCDDEEFLFEAINEKERDRIVYLFKVVVARLASQAVVGNGEGMLGEFFVPSSYGVH